MTDSSLREQLEAAIKEGLDLWWTFSRNFNELPEKLANSLERFVSAGLAAARADEREKTTDGEWIVRLIPDRLDGGWIASCDNLPGCMTQGEDQAEALHYLSDAVALVMEVRSAEPKEQQT